MVFDGNNNVIQQLQQHLLLRGMENNWTGSNTSGSA